MAKIKSDMMTFFHHLMAKSSWLVRIAVSLSFHSRKLFKYHLSDGSTIKDNGEFLLAKTVSPNLTSFIDVGANEGDWVEIVLSDPNRVFKAILYEPNQLVYEKLKARFSHIQCLIIENVAVGEKGGNKVFYESQKFSNLSSFVHNKCADGVETIVKVITLDEDVQKHQLTEVDFLKIDTEGYDLQVLNGAKNLFAQNKIGIVQFEYNRDWLAAGSTLKYAINFLESYGYNVYLLKHDGLYKFRYDWYGEYAEYSNFVGVSSRFNWLETKLFKGII